MEIVIESPADNGGRINRSNGIIGGVGVVGLGIIGGPSSEYFKNLSNQRLGGTGPELLSSTRDVRRVDRSGLLEMPLRDPLPENLIIDSGLPAQRRVDRSGLLESVSEIPDHIAYAKSRLLIASEIGRQQSSTLTLPRIRSHRERRSSGSGGGNGGGSDDAKETIFKSDEISRFDNFGNVSATTTTMTTTTSTSTSTSTASAILSTKTTSPNNDSERTKAQLSPNPSSSPRSTDPRVSSPAGLSIPDVIEAHEIPTGIPMDVVAPEGERAEAEGCEHTAIESIEEARVSFKGPKKKIVKQNNTDGIQTLRVIILSEQL